MGYSRVYVLQHYVMDVYAGALIGFCIAFFTTFLIYKNLLTPHWQNTFSKSKK
jgi:membrane-associated phospholipid phosphatase